MIVISGLKSLQVIHLGIVNSKGIAEVKESLARTVVSIVSMLVNMGVCIAVEDGNSHVIGNSGASIGRVGIQSMVGKSAGWLK